MYAASHKLKKGGGGGGKVDCNMYDVFAAIVKFEQGDHEGSHNVKAVLSIYTSGCVCRLDLVLSDLVHHNLGDGSRLTTGNAAASFPWHMNQKVRSQV